MHPRIIAATTPGAILLETTRRVCDRPARSWLFQEPVAWLEVRQLDELPALFAQLEAARAKGLWSAGFLAYECGYHWQPRAAPAFHAAPGDLPLAVFGLYRAPERVKMDTSGPPACPLVHAKLRIPPAVFAQKIAAIRSWIAAGDTYQVNLTDRIESRFDGDPAALFAHMMAAQPVEFGALLRVGPHTILSASPELFFRQRGREIMVRPMKGTAVRGRDAEEDAARAQALAADPKNRAENIMIVDLMRSDLGRLAETGSVQVRELFSVETFPSLLQMSSEVTATLRPEISLYDIFGSLFPSGSIVGAPKLRTMQLLRELEEGRERGPYTGAIGFIAPDGEAVFSVSIRTAVLHREEFAMGVGAGITWSSDAAAEYAECALKGAFLTEAPFRLIETMRWENGACELLERHLDRLRASAAYFSFPFHREEAATRLTRHARAAGAGAWKLRCELDSAGQLFLFAPEPVEPDPDPLRVLLWPEAVHSQDRFLRHKTTRRELYARALAAARAAGCADALFTNERGDLTEGAIHNVVLQHGALWRTPPLHAGVLPGVYRAHMFSSIPALREAILTPADLHTANAIWLTNAVRGARSVSGIVRYTIVAEEPRCGSLERGSLE